MIHNHERYIDHVCYIVSSFMCLYLTESTNGRYLNFNLIIVRTLSAEGQVALIIGGTASGPSVELYSPDGKCQHRLPDIPIGGLYYDRPALAFINDKILSCAGHSQNINSTVSKPTFTVAIRLTNKSRFGQFLGKSDPPNEFGESGRPEFPLIIPMMERVG